MCSVLICLVIAIPKSEREHAEFHGMKHANASIMNLVKRQRIDPFPMLAINGSAAFSGEAWTAGTPPSIS
jgi:hypothetical protein